MHLLPDGPEVSDLVAFLAARLDEDEAAAREFHEVRTCGSVCTGWDYDFNPDRCDCGHPARLFREAEAKRAILMRHSIAVSSEERALVEAGDGHLKWEDILAVDCAVCGWVSDTPGSGCPDLRALAAVWSDHPDYDPAWKPQ